MISKPAHKPFIIIFFILIFAFILRFINLTGDAPAGDISRSGVFYVDEGTYAHNAVNKALFGQWFLQDDYNAISNVPIFSLFQFGFLKTFGVSLKTIRFGGLLYSLLSIFLLWIFLKPFDPRAAWLALIFGAGNYFFIIYNRLALLENLLVLFLVVITGFLFLYYRKKKLIWLMLATVFFIAGYFIKATIIFYAPLFIFTVLYSANSLKTKFLHLSIVLLTGAVLTVFSYYAWILPHHADWTYFQSLNIAKKFTLSPVQITANYGRYLFNLKLFQFMPVTYILFLFSIGSILIDLVKRKTVTFVEVFFTAWGICVFLFLGFFAYSPPRFSLILMPAIFSLVALFLAKFLRGAYEPQSRTHQTLILAVFCISCLQIGFGFFRITRDGHFYLSCFLPLLSLPTLLLLHLSQKTLQPVKFYYSFITAILFLNLFQIGHYHVTVKHSYFNAMKSMEKIIQQAPEKKRVLAGDIAPLVATELKVKAVNIIFREETERLRFLEQRPGFLVLQDKNELIRLKQKMPDFLHNIELLRTNRIFENYIKNEDTYFYKIN